MKIDWFFWVAMVAGGLSWLFFENNMTPLAVIFGLVFIGLLIWDKIAALIDAYRPEAPQEGESK